MNQNTKRRIMLYVGAGWDAQPLDYPSVLKNHDIIIYIDSLPEEKHYKPNQAGYLSSQSEENIIKGLEEQGGRQFFAGTPQKHPSKQNIWTIPLQHNTTLMYFFNLRDDKIAENEDLLDLLPDVTTMWVQGFSPCQLVYDYVPNLKLVYVSLGCRDNLPANLEFKAETIRIMDVEFHNGHFICIENDSDDESDNDSDDEFDDDSDDDCSVF